MKKATSTAMMKYRDVQIHTKFRPDFYEYWPVFTDIELMFRQSYLPFHLATLLTYDNLLRFCSFDKNSEVKLREFFCLPFDSQRKLLSDVLHFVGFPALIANAIGAVPREIFVTRELQRFSYINMSIPYSNNCWTTMPRLIANMLNNKLFHSYNNIVEIGVGCGYHLICMHKLMNNKSTNYFGYEINTEYAQFGINVIKNFNLSNIKIFPKKFNSDVIKDYNSAFFYFTSAPNKNDLEKIIDLIPDNSAIMVPRKLYSSEYRDDKFNYLYDKFGTYSNYLEESDYLCLTIYKKNKNKIVEYPQLYDVSFVPFLNSDEYSDSIYIGDRFDYFNKII